MVHRINALKAFPFSYVFHGEIALQYIIYLASLVDSSLKFGVCRIKLCSFIRLCFYIIKNKRKNV